jgi:hypothetical protein
LVSIPVSCPRSQMAFQCWNEFQFYHHCRQCTNFISQQTYSIYIYTYICQHVYNQLDTEQSKPASATATNTKQSQRIQTPLLGVLDCTITTNCLINYLNVMTHKAMLKVDMYTGNDANTPTYRST